MKKIVLYLSLLVFFSNFAYTQVDSSLYGDAIKRIGLNYYNFADPTRENIEVYVWGGVKNPGIYLIAKDMELIRLITLTGGMPDDRMYESFKLIRPKNKTGRLESDSAYVFSYRDLFDPESKGMIRKNNPNLQAGDMLVFPLRPEKDFWDIASRWTGVIILPLLGIATLIISIINLSR
ncbi:MAG: SLBB domain-containing protein [Ignavibacteria bacterium]